VTEDPYPNREGTDDQPHVAKSGASGKKMSLVFSICAAAVILAGIVGVVVTVMRAGSVVDKIDSTISSSIAALPGLTSTAPTANASVAQQVSDGKFQFVVDNFEFKSVIEDRIDPTITVSPHGVFVVVHMTATNTGSDPQAFMASLQKLTADGKVYEASSDAGVHLGGVYEDVNPGNTLGVAMAYDVPIGVTPESIELHEAPFSNGVIVKL